MSSPVLIYPLFFECVEYTLDPFWKEIFYNCSCNRFPRNLIYNSKENAFRIRIGIAGCKTKNEIIAISSDTIDIFKTMMIIFREKLGLYSPRDLQTQTQELEDIKEQNRVNLACEWKKLKPRSLRDELIMNYVGDLKKGYQLNDKETKNLLTTIQLGFQYKKIIADNVDYNNGVINDITGLVFCSEERKFIITNESRTVSKSEKIIHSRRFHQSLDQFVREYKNRRLKPPL